MFLSRLKDIVEFTTWRDVAFVKILTKTMLADPKLNYWKTAFSSIAVIKLFQAFLKGHILNNLGYRTLYRRNEVDLMLLALATALFAKIAGVDYVFI